MFKGEGLHIKLGFKIVVAKHIAIKSKSLQTKSDELQTIAAYPNPLCNTTIRSSRL